MEIYGYKRNYLCTLITWLAIIATGFLLRLVFFWKPHWMLYATYSRCPLFEAEKVLLIDKYKQYFVEEVKTLILHKSSYAQFRRRRNSLDDSHQQHQHRKQRANDRNSDLYDDAVADEDILYCPDNWFKRRATSLSSKRPSQTYGSFVSRCGELSFGAKTLAKTGEASVATAFDSQARQRTYSARSTVSSNLGTDFNDDEQNKQSLQNYEAVKVEDLSLLIEMDRDGGGDADARNNNNSSSKNQDSTKQNGALSSMENSFESSLVDDSRGNKSLGDSSESFSSRNKDSIVELSYFENKKLRYVWDDKAGSFVRLRGLDQNVRLSELKRMTGGLTEQEQYSRRLLFDENAIRIQVQSYAKILFEEVLGPFYIFQLFSIAVWFNDNYYYYGTCIIAMSVASLVSSTLQSRRNQQQLRDKVESIDYIKVCRGNNGLIEEVESSELVPGDVVVVPTFNTILQFDAILINGNVIVNESMLTGECVPVTKTPFPFESASSVAAHLQRRLASSADSRQQQSPSTTTALTPGTASTLAQVQRTLTTATIKRGEIDICYDEKEHSKHTLFSGTKILQTRYYGGANVKALVLRTGFQTTKGELIRSIMFPKPVDFRFNRQIHKFVGVLAACAIAGAMYTVALMIKRGADPKEILISALDLITITVPPALPAAMTIGIIYAQARLKRNKIFCISPRSINISGSINCVCFDKTGTLTEDDLSFNEVVPLDEKRLEFGKPFDEDIMQTASKQEEREHNLLLESGDYSPLMNCLASCHSLTEIDGELIGDPLDLQMFRATGWDLEEPDVDDENKFDLLAPTIVRPPRHKRKTPASAEHYNLPRPASDERLSASSSTEDELEAEASGALLNRRRRCQDVGVLRQFPFSSSLQRMSVITRQFNGQQYVVYAKGAPEKIASLCEPKTLPRDFHDVLQRYTRKGFRVIALAYRPLKQGLSYAKMQRASRPAFEKDLRFLGLLTLGNLLKPETVAAIETLNKAQIRTVMVTGDNMLTAISVANECGMVRPYDRTVLLQVDRSSSDVSGELTTKPPSPPLSIVVAPETETQKQLLHAAKPAKRPKMSPLILSVEDAEEQFCKRELDPILCSPPERSSKLAPAAPPPKPPLAWKYVSNDIEFAPSVVVNGVRAVRGSGEVLLKLADTKRLHLALTGDTWDVLGKHYPELVNAVCVRGTVFARMSPNQKQQLVERLQSLQYFVGMCGDGANDSGALRAAHAGISLSDTEASVAAPFTSANANISCVPTLIREGRATLVTAFSILKYMAMYSLIQFSSVLTLRTMYANFTDFEFMYQDLFIIAVIVAFFGRTEPYPQLSVTPPPASLISVTQLTSCGIQVLLTVSFQMLACVLLWQKPWYKEHTPDYDKELDSQDNYAIFAMSAFQCISLAIIFSKGKPYRKSIFSNYLFLASLIVMIVTTVVVLLLPTEWEIPILTLGAKEIPTDFRVLVICLALFHFILAYIGERFIVDHLLFMKSGKLFEILGLGSQKLLYQKIDQNTQSTHWLSSKSIRKLPD